MKRDLPEFEQHGIGEDTIDELEQEIESFVSSETDVESVSDQADVTEKKDAKAEELRVAIRNVKTRVARIFAPQTAKYRKFGNDELAHQNDADLHVTGILVAKVSKLHLDELKSTGLTGDMLKNIEDICRDFLELIVEVEVAVGDRDEKQERRVEAGNAIYKKLVEYSRTGRNIWETTNVAKTNDYILNDTVSGEQEEETPTV